MYTTKQRNKIYKKALRLLPGILESGSGICLSIREAGGDNNAYSKDLARGVLPELYLFMPDEKVWFWFDENDLQVRQIVLDFCILMTEQ